MFNRQLSRLDITGYVNEKTPLCVIKEIADSHGITYDCGNEGNTQSMVPREYNLLFEELCVTIGETEIPHVSAGKAENIKTAEEWTYIARFINKDESLWTRKQLSIAYDFIIKFMHKDPDPIRHLPQNFTIGQQTCSQPENINSCVLYKICAHYGINTNINTTPEQMQYGIKLLRESRIFVQSMAEEFITRCTTTEMINFLLSPSNACDIITPEIDLNKYNKSVADYSKLESIRNLLADNIYLRKSLMPITDAGCIASAAISYQLDISRAKNVVKEYRYLKACGKNKYHPLDGWMSHWYIIYPDMFDLTKRFNPLIPSSYYDQNILLSMALREGYNINNVEVTSAYELLQIAYVSKTFHTGPPINLANKTTLFDLDDVEQVPYGELLYYGQYENPLQPVTVDELISMFNSNQNFTDCFELEMNAMFTSQSINKLVSIVIDNNDLLLSPDTIKKRLLLVDIINKTINSTRDVNNQCRQLSSTYRNASPDTKELILSTLINIMHMGMYMRGWQGEKDDYPLVKAPIHLDNNSQIAINVTESINSYEAKCRSLGKIGIQINSLPLLLYRDGEYNKSTLELDGLTIGERIAIVKQGDEIKNIASCIRLSSNWLCSSAHKYITAIGEPEPFDIFRLGRTV